MEHFLVCPRVDFMIFEKLSSGSDENEKYPKILIITISPVERIMCVLSSPSTPLNKNPSVNNLPF